MLKNIIKIQLHGIFTTDFHLFNYLDQKIYRGCMSDFNSRLICDEEYVNKTGICVKCLQSNCNSAPKFKAPTLSCVECMGYEECTFGQSSKETVKCKNDVMFGNDETCFVRYHAGKIFVLSLILIEQF